MTDRLYSTLILLHVSITMCCYGHLEKAGDEDSRWFLLIATVILVFNFAEFNSECTHSTNTC